MPSTYQQQTSLGNLHWLQHQLPLLPLMLQLAPPSLLQDQLSLYLLRHQLLLLVYPRVP